MGNIMEDSRLGKESLEQGILKINMTIKSLIHRRRK